MAEGRHQENEPAGIDWVQGVAQNLSDSRISREVVFMAIAATR